MPSSADIKQLLQTLPDKPGVYKFLDENGAIIYIGKAKSLKKRVSSYFNKQKHESAKLKVLVRKIKNIDHIVVETESDALLLENNLIKKHQPRYNINLKDDKTFPWICIKNEAFPRVFSTRKLVNDGSKYFGPYTSAHTVRTLLDLIRQLYPLRTCKHKLSEENIQKAKFKVCLEYHLGNCLGPCAGLQSEEDYSNAIENIQNILKGNLSDVTKYLKTLMNKFASEVKFEEAESIKQKIIALEKFQMKSTIVSNSIKNLDVFSYLESHESAFINFLKVNNGSIVQAHTVEIKKKLDEKPEEILMFAILEIRERLFSRSKEILIPFNLKAGGLDLKFLVPKRGDKKKLLDLSMRNAKYYMLERKKQSAMSKPKQALDRKLETLRKDLRLKTLPLHIECFDNSNIQGSNPVAACVVFRDLLPSKREYRHFNIKTVEGPDDFASMKEVVIRRYKRMMLENVKTPDLIVIDGGKGQLNAAVAGLEELDLRGKIAILGIAKRLEEIYFPDDPIPLYLDKNSESLKIIQQLRNEAHRFGINFHRQKRSSDMIQPELLKIRGLGEKSQESLINKFGSLDNLKKADKSEIIELLGKKRADLVWNALILKNT